MNTSNLFRTSFHVVIVLLVLCLDQRVEADVVQLTNDNFEQEIAKYELVFMNFYADWCRFSQLLTPVFEEASDKIAQEFPGRVLFGKIDCETETTLGTRFHISKYPTLKLIMNGKVMKREYRAQRSVDGITGHVRDLLKDPIKHLSTYDEYNKIDEKKPAIIAYFHDPNSISSNDYMIVRKVALDLRDDCNFFWVTGDPSSSNLDSGASHKVLFKPSRNRPGEKDLNYPGGLHSYNELSTWSTDKCIPMVREITFENAEELTEEGLPFLILFHHPDDKQTVDDYTKVVHNELYTESANMNFLMADGVKFAHPLHHLGKSQKDLPLIAIDSFRHMYMFPNFKELTVPGKLKTFVLDLHSGKLHREFHFGPDPTGKSNDNGIATSPPESTFKKLAPSSSRYTLLKDEL